jgi:hypothetical protein
MAKQAKIEGGVVTSIIVADAAFDGHDVEVPNDKVVGIGTAYDPGTGFDAPDLVVASQAVPLTALQFMDLFTPSEEGAIRMLARSTDPSELSVSVQMESFLARIVAAQGIFLDDPRVVAGAQALRALGILDTDERLAQVLSGSAPA